MRKKENALYRKSTYKYHNNLKITTGLQPRARDQPNLVTIKVPQTNEIASNHHTIIDTCHSYFEAEQSRIIPNK
jgi:hypothetical protein